MEVGDKIVSIKKLYNPSGAVLLIDEYETCTIYSLKPIQDVPLSISISNKNNYTITLSNAVGNKYYIWDYFITLDELRKLKLNKLKENINGSK